MQPRCKGPARPGNWYPVCFTAILRRLRTLNCCHFIRELVHLMKSDPFRWHSRSARGKWRRATSLEPTLKHHRVVSCKQRPAVSPVLE